MVAPHIKDNPKAGADSKYGSGKVKAAIVRGTTALMTRDMVTLPAIRMRFNAAMLKRRLHPIYLEEIEGNGRKR